MDVAQFRASSACALAALTLSLTLVGCAKDKETAQTTFPETKAQCVPNAVPHKFLVQWKDGTRSVVHGERENLLREFVTPNLEKIEFVEQAQRVYINDIIAHSVVAEREVPLSEEWGQQMIEADSAYGRGDYFGQGVTVAIVDSGVDVTHPQLKSHLFINTGEIPGNGIDDDGNGLVDDVSGFDYANVTGHVTDPNGHGTHLAGVVAASGAEGSMKGIAPQAKILPMRFMSDDSGDIELAIRAMDDAVKMGARVINASWGGLPSCNKTLGKAIQDAEAHGTLVSVASGNDGKNLDITELFPAAYGLSGQITVGASTALDKQAGFSNFSTTLVHLVAPGHQIYSTFPVDQGSYAVLSGTSMAAPFVSGAAAVLFSARPKATVAQVKRALLESVDPGNFAVSTKGRLNLKKAVALLLQQVP